jgi:hypothetical protein
VISGLVSKSVSGSVSRLVSGLSQGYASSISASIRTSIAAYVVTFDSLSFPVLQLVPRPLLQLVPRTSLSLSFTVETGSFISATVSRIGTWSRKTWNKAANLEGTAYLITGSQSDGLLGGKYRLP